MSQNYSHLKIRLASPEEIRSWSYGEVLNHETINYRTLKPEKGGLFAEEIFGPVKDYQCACSNKSKKNTNIENKKCPICGVEITEAKVRRERMGHITLAAPIVHTWYLKSTPSKLALLLGIKASDLEEVVYLASYIVVEPGDTDLEFKQILTEFDFMNAYNKWGNRFSAKTGGEAVLALLKKLDLENEVVELRKELKSSSKQRREQVVKRLSVVEAFKNSDNNPEWMVLTYLPVIPPDLRPMVELDGGRFATTGLNDLYRRILNRNKRLKAQIENNSPHLITKNEKRLLQEAVDALIDNSKRGKKAATSASGHPLKCLSEQLRGKQGRFRQNLLGKRVDYSGRSVIVVGPSLEMHQCGVPREMALILFKPFVIHELVKKGISTNVKSAKKLIDNKDDKVWGPLEDVVREHPVLLNRAPTLHRLGIQAFEPILIDGKAIRLHPLACPAFNADFDGDQMSIHVPLSEEAQAEARIMMLASNNILNPKDGSPLAMPSQDMILGNYYLSMEAPGEEGEGRVFKDIDEAEMAYLNHQITLHTRIAFKASSLPFEMPVEHTNDYFITTYGKIIFNSVLSKGFPYINEPSEENLKKHTPDKFFCPSGTNIKEFIKNLDESRKDPMKNPFGTTERIKKGFLKKIIAETFARYKTNETSKMLDRIKNLGFHYSTVSGITVSAFDVDIYKPKYDIVKEAQAKVEKYNDYYALGELTNEERYKIITNKVWPDANKRIAKELIEDLTLHHSDNHFFIMYDSGARGSDSNFTQLAGMRGLMNDTKGNAIEIPITNCLREGLSMREFFVSTHGSRKGSTDTALKTADSGYLTRRLVDVSQDVAIREYDCGTDKGVMVSEISNPEANKAPIESLYSRILGRYAYRDCISPVDGSILAKRNDYIDEAVAKKIVDSGIKEVGIRTVCTCNSRNGICVKCYGRNMATSGIVEVGEAVGIIASQSIGEPGTQLTMRTFHSGGVAGSDITSGLPRVQELFEARNPKGECLIAEFAGKVSLGVNTITIAGEHETKTYPHKPSATLKVENGDIVAPGQQLTEGSVNLRQLLRATNIETVQQYIIREVQKVYSAQGVGINDKHIEIIVRQMTKRLIVQLEGDTKLLPGALISSNHYADANAEALLNGKKPSVASPVILGITKASLRSDSFLSAASFQETTKVLTDAAIAGATDYLKGIKENVIIGGLIPAGTGILQTTKFEYQGLEETELEDEYSDYDN